MYRTRYKDKNEPTFMIESRNIVTLSAKCDKENSIYVYYQKKKQEGKHYYACLTACCTKLIRIIYALCMNNSTQQN